MRANHNLRFKPSFDFLVVSNVSKILKWEQITTKQVYVINDFCCFQCFKDTKMRANHNIRFKPSFDFLVVSNVSKILKWEQITTKQVYVINDFCCFQCFKDTKMRANHNRLSHSSLVAGVVSNVSKILKWEQITTIWVAAFSATWLFPMFQRY